MDEGESGQEKTGCLTGHNLLLEVRADELGRAELSHQGWDVRTAKTDFLMKVMQIKTYVCFSSQFFFISPHPALTLGSVKHTKNNN